MEDSPVLMAPCHSHRWSTLSAGGAVALALVIGLAYVNWLQPLAVDKRPKIYLRYYPGVSGPGLWADEFQYLSIAKCITTGAGYSLAPGEPTAVRVPGYPLYVAMLFRIFGSSHAVALLGNVFLIALLPWFTFALAKPAFGCSAAGIAAFSCALDPGLYFYVLNEANSEALFTVLLCAAILMWRRVQPPYSYEGGGAERTTANTGSVPLPNVPERRGTAFAVAAGVLFGAANLTRPGFLGLPFFIVLMEFLVRRRNLSWNKATVFCLTFVLVMFPWALRNRAVMGRFMFSTTNDGVTLLGTVLAAQQHRGDWIDPEFVAPEYARAREIPDPVERNQVETRLAIAALKKTPLATLLEVAAKRVFRMWVPLNRIVSDDVAIKANVAVNLFYFPFMLLAAFGLWIGLT